MTNIRQISPKSVWTNAGEKSATALSLINFKDYHFDNGNGTVIYGLIGPDNSDGMEIYFEGSIVIPSSVIQNWGESDDIIWNYVGEQLNVEFI